MIFLRHGFVNEMIIFVFKARHGYVTPAFPFDSRISSVRAWWFHDTQFYKWSEKRPSSHVSGYPVVHRNNPVLSIKFNVPIVLLEWTVWTRQGLTWFSCRGGFKLGSVKDWSDSRMTALEVLKDRSCTALHSSAETTAFPYLKDPLMLIAISACLCKWSYQGCNSCEKINVWLFDLLVFVSVKHMAQGEMLAAFIE